ncbi:MAG: hypothetical protein PHP93_05785 [Kiritimatiellales bacterium]|nr:hypothetical protein [Kiritimatiellales bacterium]
MKNLILPVILLFLAGCDYEIPLSRTPSAPANPALTGSWTGHSSDGKPVSMEVKTSGTDYSVTYTEGSDTISFKGFEISAAGLNLIQLELQNVEKQKYLFVKYELTPDSLMIYRLNPDVVSAKCQSAKEMLNDIDVHRQNPFLFKKPLKFTKSASQ